MSFQTIYDSTKPTNTQTNINTISDSSFSYLHPVNAMMAEELNAVSIDSGIYLSNTSTQSQPSKHDQEELEQKLNNLNLATQNFSSLSENVMHSYPGCASSPFQLQRECLSTVEDIDKSSSIFDNQTNVAFNFNLPQNSDGDTILHLAVIQNDVKQLALSLRRLSHQHLNIQNNNYLHTPLHLASVIGSHKCARLLTILGASSNIQDRSGDTPLHIACARGDLALVQKLTLPPTPQEIAFVSKIYPNFTITSTPNTYPPNLAVNMLNYDGKPPIHLAYSQDNPDSYSIIKYLVTNCNADINAVEGKCGFTLLHEMVKLGDEIGVVSLLNLPIPPTSNPLNINYRCYGNMTPLDMAVCLDRNILVGVLTRQGGSQSEYHSFKSDD